MSLWSAIFYCVMQAACPPGKSKECVKTANAIVDSAFAFDMNPVPVLIVSGIESNLQPDVQCSGKNACGPMQITPVAERHASLMAGKWLDRRSHFDNAEIGVLYLKWLKTRYKGDFELVLIGYNAGPRVADCYQNKICSLPQETRDYLRRANALKNQCRVRP